MSKKRLDVRMTELGLAESRQKAQAMISGGQVFVDGKSVTKSGAGIAETAQIEVRGKTLQYVSRGGLKLEKDLNTWPISLDGVTAMDCGASTGGFTDCMLQSGARKVYAVDVGCGQLAQKLREDSRVVNLEHTNARYLTGEQIPEALDFVSVDVSFISLGLILPVLRQLMSEQSQLVCLIKPQFEAGRGNVGKNGVVRDPAVHLRVLRQFLTQAHESRFTVRGITFSPIRGPEGNIEYLGWLAAEPGEDRIPDLAELVRASHQTLERMT